MEENSINNSSKEEMINAFANINPMKTKLDSLTPEQLMSIYDLSIRAKKDKNLNVVSEIPKEVYDIIQEDGKTLGLDRAGINVLAREMVIAFGEEIALDKDLKELNKELAHAKEIPEFMDLYGEALRETYEDKMLEAANNATDPKDKELYLAVRSAFIESYTLTKLIDYVECKEPGSRDRLIRIMWKKADKYCDDFDFTLNKVIAKKTSIRSVVKSLTLIYPDIEQWRAELFAVILAIVCKNASVDDKGMMMYMYASIFNITALGINADKVVKDDIQFSTERKQYLDKFFDASRQTFPDKEFPKYEPVRTKKQKHHETGHQGKS